MTEQVRVEGTSRVCLVHHPAQFRTFPRMEIHNLSRPPVPVLDHSHSEKKMLCLTGIPHILLCVCCLLSYCFSSKKCLALPSPCPSLRLLKTAVWSSQSILLRAEQTQLCQLQLFNHLGGLLLSVQLSVHPTTEH